MVATNDLRVMTRRAALLAVMLVLAACGAQTKAASAASAERPAAAASEPAEWSYSGATGPAHWAELDPAFAACANGREQSPIDIERERVKPVPAETPVVLRYEPVRYTVINTGHTIQANPAEGANAIVLDGEAYRLAQIHFHHPSEHRFDGRDFAMEVHFVHRNARGKLAVVGVMLREGAARTALKEMWAKLPAEETADGEGVRLHDPIDLDDLLPKSKTAYRYDGSLTTPPCSEQVEWVVMKEAVELSAEQIEAFAAIFPDNHRPVQPLGDRKVTEAGTTR